MKVRILPRTLHFKQPAGTSRGVYHDRRVWHIVITYTQNGHNAFGLGECAPLYDLSCDFTEDYENTLFHFCHELEVKGFLDYDALRPYPSILFGLETALLSAKASLRGNYLELFDTPFARGETGIPINGLVWMGSKDEMLARMEEKLEAGFRCIKLKIGAIDWESELEMIRVLRRRFSSQSVEIRVDANGGFTTKNALSRLEELAKYGIHSIEQPIRQGQWKEMAALCRTTPLPIALDEELIGLNTLERKEAFLDEIRPQYLVLKPSLHGGIHGSEEWIREAAKRKIPYWITSALESNIGLNAIAQWASSLPGRQKRPRHQGLGTGMLFEHNFEHAQLYIEGEKLWRTARETREFRKQLNELKNEWESSEPTLTVQTSGSTGIPKQMPAEKARIRLSAAATCRFLNIGKNDQTLLCMPLKYIGGKMQAIRSFLNGSPLIVVKPSAHPLKDLKHSPDFAAMTPMQVWESLQVPRERRLLRGIRRLLIGGGSISRKLQEALRRFPHEVYSTYGMTETLSHIALRRLNGPDAEDYYRPLPNVKVSSNPDGCLVIKAPVCQGPLTTNDLAEVLPDGRFRILGRRDNVVCSGGIKWQVEEIEQKIGLDSPFLLTSVPDERLGEALTLLYESPATEEMVSGICRQRLSRYEVPKHFIHIDRLPRTETGKPARAKAKEEAIRVLNSDT